MELPKNMWDILEVISPKLIHCLCIMAVYETIIWEVNTWYQNTQQSTATPKFTFHSKDRKHANHKSGVFFSAISIELSVGLPTAAPKILQR